jgi:hypothetical protein
VNMVVVVVVVAYVTRKHNNEADRLAAGNWIDGWMGE